MEYGFERFELIMLVGMAYMNKRLYDVFLSAMLFYTYCHRVHLYFMGFFIHHLHCCHQHHGACTHEVADSVQLRCVPLCNAVPA